MEITFVGIWFIDKFDNTIFLSSVIAEFLGLTVDEILYEPIFSWIDEVNLGLILYYLHRCHQGISDEYNLQFPSQNGLNISARIAMNPLFNEANKYLGTLAIIKEIIPFFPLVNTLDKIKQIKYEFLEFASTLQAQDSILTAIFNLANSINQQRSQTFISTDNLFKDLQVLVVDNDKDTRDLVKTILEDIDAQVTEAETVSEAIEILSYVKPNLLISDIAMPEEDGYMLIQQLRNLQDESLRAIPALALTGYARLEDRQKAFDAGFQMYLFKPVDLDELLGAIALLAGYII